MQTRSIPSLLLLALLALPLHAAPDWAEADAKAILPDSLTRGKDACIVRDELDIVVQPDGSRECTQRYSVRILMPSGSAWAVSSMHYKEGVTKVRKIKGWLFKGKKVLPTKSDAYVEVAADTNGLRAYSVGFDDRLIKLEAPELPAVGSTFSAEMKYSDNDEYLGEAVSLHGHLPTLAAKLSVTLPVGWSVKARDMFPAAPPAQYAKDPKGHQWTWTRFTPPVAEIAIAYAQYEVPAVLVSFVPPGGAAPRGKRYFATWEEYARHYLREEAQSCLADDHLRVEAKRIAGDDPDPWVRIRNLTTVVQRFRYITRSDGNYGTRAEPAPVVLKRGYGDCHDKATLLKTMLREIGVRAHVVLLNGADATAVQREGVMGAAFNHAILAIEPPADYPEAPVADVPGLGRVLFFDPTMEDLPLGFLPVPSQGGWALVLAPGVKDLVRLPVEPLERSKSVVRTDLRLDAKRQIEADVTVMYTGYAAEGYRQLLRLISKGRFEEAANQLFSGSLVQPKLTLLSSQDAYDKGDLHMVFKVAGDCPKGSRVSPIQVLDPRLIKVGGVFQLPAEIRRQAVNLPSVNAVEEVTVHLPPGAKAEDIPATINLETEWCTYSLKAERVEAGVRIERVLRMPRARVEAVRAAELKVILDRIAAADRCTLVIRMPQR